MADQKPKPNPALRMLGLPNLPRKLPSRNWLIFWGISTSLAAAIIYDRREKKRATARWVAAVAPLAREPLPDTSAMPRRVTVYLEAPPGDVLRAAQDHFSEYVKPVLASSGIDWDFVVGRRQGDVRAVVAERVRRSRRAVEHDLDGSSSSSADAPTDEDVVEAIRRRNGIPEYEGVKGDLIVGRHTWKEYVRGLHEGWLGPLSPPPEPENPAQIGAPTGASSSDSIPPTPSGESGDAATPTPAPTPASTPPSPPPQPPAAPAEEEAPPKRPPQPKPYNTVESYPSSPLPRFIPAELGPSVPIPFPHLLGFLSTPIRLWRFLHRRELADQIGREVAAACFAATARPFRESLEGCEQGAVLAHEEKDWVKTVWKDEKKDEKKDDNKDDNKAPADDSASPTAAHTLAPPPPPPAPEEKPWRAPVVVDPRIGSRMRRFELAPEQEAAARAIVVPEEEIEGWTKGTLRQLGRWAVRKWTGADQKKINVGNLDSDD